MQWVDTGSNAKIKNIEMPDGSLAIGIIGITAMDYAWQKAVSDLNFKVSVSGRVLLKQGKIRFSDVKAMFPNAKVVEMSEKDVFVYRKTSNERGIKQDSQSVTLLGKNYLGQEVYQTTTGSRFVKSTDSEQRTVSEDGNLSAGIFLRKVNDGDIELCADGFIVRAETEYLRAEDLKSFCAIIHGESKPVEATDNRLREAQEAVEIAFNRRINIHYKNSSNKELRALFEFAENLQNRLPNMIYRTGESIELQQYSTPATLSIAAQYALGNVAGQSVLEPTIGNASLITALEGAQVTGVEIDRKRYEQTRNMIDREFSTNTANIIHGNFLDIDFEQQFDVVISNPPFGRLLGQELQISGLNITRRDQQILMRALELRKDNGRALFIIGADYENNFKGKEGILNGGSEKLFNWLVDHYEIKAFEVSGNLYKSQGAGYPVRFIAVGAKRSETEALEARESKAYRIKQLPVATTLDEVWAYAGEVRDFLASQAPSDEEQQANIEQINFELGEQLKENPEFGNDYQAQYTPMTQGATSAMIPKNLVVPQAKAFAKFMDENGDPELYVKNELQLNDLSDFEPEQIDAIAMGIWNMKRGRALILGDQTGMGKGRIVAAITRWAALNDKQANFLTEKPGLFSDLWRDMTDIHSENLFTPFILNADEKIVSLSGNNQDVLVPKTNRNITKTMLANNTRPIDAGYNLMLSTYSQYNKLGSDKALFLLEASKNSIVVLDESHNAAGESNTGENVTQAINQSLGVIYSSATYAKNPKSMTVYAKAFPLSVNVHSLRDTLIAGGEPLQEVLSSMLCEDGVLLRREHDLSRLKFKTLSPSDDGVNQNIKVSDKVANVLQIMSYLSGDIEKVSNRIQKKILENLRQLSDEQRRGNRMGVSYVNFGSRLYNIMRQLSLVLSADMVADNAIQALNNGQKPVIVLEQTMESVINELTDGLSNDNADGESKEELIDESMKPLTLKHLLSRMLTKLTLINVTNDYGSKKKVSVFEIGEPAEVAAINKIITDLTSFIENTVEFDILAMPIDTITHKIKQAGYTCGEVSGRSKSYSFDANGNAIVEKGKRDKNREIFAFNSGESDAVILTRSGCTGISLHAGPKFADQRQRIMIEAQITQNVNERVQFFGRVNRRGQLSVPEIWSVTSGLVWENRALAMQNIKLRKLSANTQSDRNNAAEIKDIPDILNEVGNEVCREYLLDHPELASIFKVDVDSDEGREGDGGYFFVSKMTLRICLLENAKQEKIYGEWFDAYKIKIEELTLKGINPLETKVLDVKARTVDRKMVVSGIPDGSVFEQPVFAEKIEWEKEVDPIRSDYIIKSANASIQNLSLSYGIDEQANDEYIYMFRKDISPALLMPNLDGWKKTIKDSAQRQIKNSVPMNIPNDKIDWYIQQQIRNDENNVIKRTHERAEWLVNNGWKVLPGTPIKFSAFDGETIGVVINMTPAKEGRHHLPGEYNLMIAIPGQKEVERLTINTLMEDQAFESLWRDYVTIYHDVDNKPAGKQVFSRWTLTGNLFKATEMATNDKLGSVGLYTTHDGNRHRAVICRSPIVFNDLIRSNVSLNKEEAKETLLKMMNEEESNKIDIGDNVTLKWYSHGETIRVSVPGTKSVGSQFFGNKKIVETVGQFAGTTTVMSATIQDLDHKRAEKMIDILYDMGLSMKVSVKQLDKKETPVADEMDEGLKQMRA